MFDSVFDIPLVIMGPTIIALLCLFALIGLRVVRRHVLTRLRVHSADSEFSGAMLQSVMVFYGLAVALIAVSVWQTYSDTSKIVSEEATALGALYRDVSSYPEPARQQLQNRMVHSRIICTSLPSSYGECGTTVTWQSKNLATNRFTRSQQAWRPFRPGIAASMACTPAIGTC